jgi:uncharacterized protein (TIGR03435 family)
LAGGFPALCGEIGGMPPSTSGRQRFTGRDVTIRQLARFLPGPDRLDVPVVDETGLTGTYDLVFEYTPEYKGPPPEDVAPPDPNGPTLIQALREQLGLKLERRKKGTINALVVAHVERPFEICHFPMGARISYGPSLAPAVTDINLTARCAG